MFLQSLARNKQLDDFTINSFENNQKRLLDCAEIGGARRDRTDDLLRARQALSQLSYGPFLRVISVFLFSLDFCESNVCEMHMSFCENSGWTKIGGSRWI